MKDLLPKQENIKNQIYSASILTIILLAFFVIAPHRVNAAGPKDEKCTTTGTAISSLSNIQSGRVNLLRSGTYSGGTVNIPAGSASNQTILKPYNCEAVTIRVSDAVLVASNATIAGLTIIKHGNSYGQAIRLNNNANTILIRNNHLKNEYLNSKIAGSHTLSSGENVRNWTVEGNIIEGCNEDCLQNGDRNYSGPFTIINNLFRGPTNENLLDIKSTDANSLVAGNYFDCTKNVPSNCVLLHGERQTSATVTFRNNTIVGCPTKGTSQLHLNGKPNIDNTYNVYDNLLSGNCNMLSNEVCSKCRIQNNKSGTQWTLVNGTTGNISPDNTTSQCSLLSFSTGATLSGYAAAYNVFSSTKELLITADCSSTQPKITIGADNPNILVYNKGYKTSGTSWTPLTLTCEGQSVSDSNGITWCRGLGTATLGESDVWFAAYTCQQIAGLWKCGCRDSACSTTANPPSGGLWQLQGIKK
jgi:hypothetical protein